MVGAVTEIETESGVVKVSDIDADLRREWAEKLVQKIEALDGVEFVGLASLAPYSNNQVGTIEVVVETKDEEFPEAIPLRINPRSFSPNLRSVCDEYAPLSSYDVTDKPTAIDASRDLYDSNLYMIDINFY